MVPPRIVVIGSSNTDLIAQVPRLPQAGETLLGGTFSIAPGGKGANQAVAAARLGAAVTLVAQVGIDDFGSQALQNFEREGLDTRFIVRDEAAPSGVALIFVGGEGENMIVVVPGANAHLTPADVDRAAEAITSAEVLLLQLEIPLETVRYAARRAAAAGTRVILNPAPAQPLPAELLQSVSILTPNRREAELLSGQPAPDATAALAAAEKLRAQGVGTVVITLGAQGALWVGEASSGLVPAPSVQALDTTAAGDAFNGALAVALGEGRELQEAICFANAAGALATTRLGAQPSLPTRREVEALRSSLSP